MAGDWRSRARPVTRSPAPVPAPTSGEEPKSDWRSRATPVAEPGTPLDKALREQTGDVVTVETPTGPTQFTRGGKPFLSGDALTAAMKSGPSPVERALEGGLSFLSGGGPLLDEGRGLAEASKPQTFWNWLANKGASPLEKYRQVRDETRRDVDRATRNASPTVSVRGREIPMLPVAGAVVSGLPAGAPATLAGRLALGGTMGGMSAAANSRADLTQGEVGDFAKDTAIGAGTGLAFAGLAEAPGAIARGAGRLMERGQAAQQAKDLLASTQQAQSAMGVAGAAGGRVQRAIEYVDEVLANPQSFTPQQAQLAQRLAADPAVAEARRRVAENAMQALRSDIAWQQQTAQEAGELMSTIPQRAAAATKEALETPYTGALLPRAERLATRAGVGAVGTAVGGATGGAVGAAPGTVQMVLNMMKDPRLQFAVGRDVNRAMSVASGPGVIAGGTEAVLAGEGAEKANRNAFDALAKRFGITAKSKEELADEAFLLQASDSSMQNGR